MLEKEERVHERKRECVKENEECVCVKERRLIREDKKGCMSKKLRRDVC